ncbi:hypothetical protein TNCV_141681 [Trichonephila clavipes]|nr:hypothetical protein TNCV_141681 [Trichonephila clavipes]
MSLESRIGVVCKPTSVCTNSSTPFAATWTLSSEIMAAATLDTASQTGASSMHQDGRIRVQWHRGERTSAECICHRHTGPSPGIILDTHLGHLLFTLMAL